MALTVKVSAFSCFERWGVYSDEHESFSFFFLILIDRGGESDEREDSALFLDSFYCGGSIVSVKTSAFFRVLTDDKG